VKTASGATAVQIVHSNRRGSREIEHIGSAHSPAELEVLRAAARQRLHAHQDAFDFGDGRPEGRRCRSPRPSPSICGTRWAGPTTGSAWMWPPAGMRCLVSWYWPGWLSRPEARLDVRLHATGKPVISRCRSDPAKLRHELATAICENWHLAAYRTSSTRRLHCGSYRGAAVTSRRGRGEDSVYLDGDRWRGAASLGYGPDRRLTVAGFLDRWLTQVFRGK